MAKTKISEFSSTPANNTDIDSINIAEGCAPSGINDAIRELMSQLKDWQSGTSNDPYVVGSSGSLTLNQGTANGVAYLNGSKVVTSGSALTFDGSALTLGGSQRINGTTTSALTIASSSGATNGFKLYNDSTNDLAYLMNFYNGSMIFGVNNAEGMRLTSTGLGIGTSSPSSILHLSSTLPILTFTDTNDSSTSRIYQDNEAFVIDVDNANAKASSSLQFRIDNSERARIDSSGYFLVNTTTTVGGAARIGVLFAGNATNGINIQDSTTTSGAVFQQFSNSAGTQIGYIGRVNTTNAVVYSTTSDYRLKEVIGPVSGAGARIDALKPIDYQWKDGNQHARGFLAHEFQEVYANSVSGTKDAVDADGKPVYQGMQAGTAEVIADLVAEIQSLRQRIAKLEAK